MTNCEFFKNIHPTSHTHLNEEFRFFYVFRDKDTQNSPQCYKRSSPLSMGPSPTVAYKEEEGVTALDRETIQSKPA